MQVIWACVHENFSACNLSISNHVTGWNTLSSTSMYTVRPPTIHVHVWSYYAALLVKPVINAGYLDQFYQTIHRLERSLSSLLYPIPPKIWTSHVIEGGMTNQNVEKNPWIFCFWHHKSAYNLPINLGPTRKIILYLQLWSEMKYNNISFVTCN